MQPRVLALVGTLSLTNKVHVLRYAYLELGVALLQNAYRCFIGFSCPYAKPSSIKLRSCLYRLHRLFLASQVAGIHEAHGKHETRAT
jgi:hypothetical protein